MYLLHFSIPRVVQTQRIRMRTPPTYSLNLNEGSNDSYEGSYTLIMFLHNTNLHATQVKKFICQRNHTKKSNLWKRTSLCENSNNETDVLVIIL